ncbi:DUF983 domain-containing protein [Limoniibacter endophyticus]|uniref:DUF983 domain-containing protein n=1 Tax=Limoniibacter endophyticus TaxID=1565040 RepID=A0A8J3DJR5_9HYPH|nr:DUF983 domain-containing protein [Limoniibacter endophyticus]GHC62335.1 hypothetical protein GCM10010136_03410 [Limoniibacter endophyticus]
MKVYGGEDKAQKPAERSLWTAMKNGFFCRCPRCGQGRLFSSFLKTAPACEVCGQEFHHHRADDLPAYLVIFLVGHIVVAGFMGAEQAFSLSMWAHLAIWLPITLVLSLALLNPVKGAVVGLQWALRMHGFDTGKEALEKRGGDH